MWKFFLKMLSNINAQPVNMTPAIANANVINENVEIQLQDNLGNWRTCHVTMNESQRIVSGMKQLAEQYPNNRIRAVDSNKRIVDIL
jgi:hypothetical protein